MAYLLTVEREIRATGVTAHSCITADGRPTRLPAWLRVLGRDNPEPRSLRIGSDRVQVDVAPDNGGRIAQITVDGVELLVGRGEGPDPGAAMAWGSYPMVPWAGRIRQGRFTFDGVDRALPVNLGGHAIHGVGFDTPWAVTHHTTDHIELELTMPSDRRWPFGGTARQSIRVADTTVRCELSATAGEHPMPVSLGWHPWFRKPEQFEFHPESMYRRDVDHIARRRTGRHPRRTMGRLLRQLVAGGAHGRRGRAPARVRLPRLGRVRHAVPRHVRRAAERTARRVQPAPTPSRAPRAPHDLVRAHRCVTSPVRYRSVTEAG